jgi:hypothetical protein
MIHQYKVHPPQKARSIQHSRDPPTTKKNLRRLPFKEINGNSAASLVLQHH